MQDFEPVGSQQRQKGYLSLEQVAHAMGLEPNKDLAASLRAPACNALMGEWIYLRRQSNGDESPFGDSPAQPFDFSIAAAATCSPSGF